MLAATSKHSSFQPLIRFNGNVSFLSSVSALAASHLVGSLHCDSEVVLSAWVPALTDEHLVTDATCLSSLFGVELSTNHLRADVPGFFRPGGGRQQLGRFSGGTQQKIPPHRGLKHNYLAFEMTIFETNIRSWKQSTRADLTAGRERNYQKLPEAARVAPADVSQQRNRK